MVENVGIWGVLDAGEAFGFRFDAVLAGRETGVTLVVLIVGECAVRARDGAGRPIEVVVVFAG